MNRLALVLAAALLGTGCYSYSPCDPNVTVDWTFLSADNVPTASCATAGVRFVDVFANGVQVGSFDCAGPPGTVALAQGLNDLVVEGVDGAGTILYRDAFPVNATTCGSQGTVAAQPSEGWVTVSYTFSPVNSCFSPGPSFIWVLVRDDLANVIAADSAAAPEANDTCGVDFPLRFRLASGSYTLLSTEEVIRGASAGVYLPKAANCTHAPFTVAAAATTPIAEVLGDTTTFCP